MSPLVPSYFSSPATQPLKPPAKPTKHEKDQAEEVLNALREFYEDEKRRQVPRPFVSVADRHQKALHEGRHRLREDYKRDIRQQLQGNQVAAERQRQANDEVERVIDERFRSDENLVSLFPVLKENSHGLKKVLKREHQRAYRTQLDNFV